MKITYLFGRICSGKSTYKPSIRRIEVSKIVKAITDNTSREELQKTMHLDAQIAENIAMVLDYYEHTEVKEVVVDGIRQPSIVEALIQDYPGEMVWLEVPVEERKRRYETRKASKDTQVFEDADNKPIELECQKIYSIFKEQIKVINN